MENFSSIPLTLFRQFPVTAVWIIGLILCLVFWRRHPKVSLLALVAIIGFLVNLLIDAYLNIKIPMLVNDSGFSTARFNFMLTMKSNISSLVSAVLWILIGVAIFGWRSKTEGSKDALEGEKNNVGKLKLNWLGVFSLILSVLLILIVLGTFSILVTVGSSAAKSGDMYGFWTGVINQSGKMLHFPFWALPLGVLNIIMAMRVRKIGAALQKNVAGLGITMGTSSIIMSIWLFFYIFIFIIAMSSH